MSLQSTIAGAFNDVRSGKNPQGSAIYFGAFAFVTLALTVVDDSILTWIAVALLAVGCFAYIRYQSPAKSEISTPVITPEVKKTVEAPKAVVKETTQEAVTEASPALPIGEYKRLAQVGAAAAPVAVERKALLLPPRAVDTARPALSLAARPAQPLGLRPLAPVVPMRREASTQDKMRLNKALTADRMSGVSDVLDIVAASLHQFDVVNMVTAVYRCAKLANQNSSHSVNVWSDTRFQSLISALSTEISPAAASRCASRGRKVIEPRGISNALWAFARLDMPVSNDKNVGLVLRLVDLAREQVTAFKAQELSNSVWACASLFTSLSVGHSSSNMLATTYDETSTPPSMGAVPAAALDDSDLPPMFREARADVRACMSTFFLLVATESRPRFGDFRPQELANTAWAFCRASHATSGAAWQKSEDALLIRVFTQALARECRQRFQSAVSAVNTRSRMRMEDCFDPQHVSALAWAVTKLDVLGTEDLSSFLHSLAAAAQMPSILHSMKPQELSNVVWAFSKSGVKCGPVECQLMSAIARRCVDERFGSFKAQDYANIGSGLAQLLPASPTRAHLLQSLCASVASKGSDALLAQYKPQEQASLLWALATCVEDFSSPMPQSVDQVAQAGWVALGKALKSSQSESAKRYSGQSLARCLWALIKLGGKDSDDSSSLEPTLLAVKELSRRMQKRELRMADMVRVCEVVAMLGSNTKVMSVAENSACVNNLFVTVQEAATTMLCNYEFGDAPSANQVVDAKALVAACSQCELSCPSLTAIALGNERSARLAARVQALEAATSK